MSNQLLCHNLMSNPDLGNCERVVKYFERWHTESDCKFRPALRGKPKPRPMAVVDYPSKLLWLASCFRVQQHVDHRRAIKYHLPASRRCRGARFGICVRPMSIVLAPSPMIMASSGGQRQQHYQPRNGKSQPFLLASLPRSKDFLLVVPFGSVRLSVFRVTAVTGAQVGFGPERAHRIVKRFAPQVEA